MKICKKCGELAVPNNYQHGYYCYDCGNLGYDDVVTEKDIYKRLLKLEHQVREIVK